MKNMNEQTLSTPPSIILVSQKGTSVRIMTKDHLRMVMRWAAKEGWNPGCYEVESLYDADPNG